MTDLTDRPATELAAMIAAGEVSSREVLDAHRARVDAVEPTINAVTYRMDEAAEAAATACDEAIASGSEVGPLHGLPVSIKDQFEAFLRGFRAVCDSQLFQKYDAEELELLICGSKEFDFEALEQSTKYEDGLHRNSQIVRVCDWLH